LGAEQLFRNDGPAGFKDVTAEAGTTAYGFSMGASWGDYDNDGLEDLYISNMFSEPGRRMAAQIGGLSKMFVESATGNWLYRQTSRGKFQQVAGMEPPAMAVMKRRLVLGRMFRGLRQRRLPRSLCAQRILHRAERTFLGDGP
jgi:hypothetical protein